jgi:hypothetical protein
LKKIVSRLIVALGAAAAGTTGVYAQEGSGVSMAEVCTNPDLADASQRLWAAVQNQDRTEIYIAYLEACGSSPLTAEFAAIARQIVVERTANFTQMPDETYRIVWEDTNPNGFTAVYIN